jgi:hypothetical protein
MTRSAGPILLNAMALQVDGLSLFRFRVVFGALMVFSTARFWYLGWIEDHYLEPLLHFTYFGFEWVNVLPPIAMYALHAVMLLSAAGIMSGILYRASTWLFFLSFTYTELIDAAYYLNHYYFVSLIALLLAAGPKIPNPAGAFWSIFIGRSKAEPLRAPSWFLYLLQFQTALVYFYAGIAKIRPEWLIDALPLRIWLPAHAQLPLIGELLAHPVTPWIFSWAGMLFDICMPFLLLNKRTRLTAWVCGVIFHTLTGMLFQIGVFPLVMIGSATLFFVKETPEHQKELTPSLSPFFRAQAAFVSLWMLFQLLFPWRYVLYPGNVLWTEEGYRFGWRVMLMEKSGTATFFVENPETGAFGAVDNALFLNPHQEKQLATQPDFILQYAQYLSTHYSTGSGNRPKVRAEVWVTLNGAPSQLLFDPELELTALKDGFSPKTWLNPWRKPEAAS